MELILKGDKTPTRQPEERRILWKNARLMGIDTNACKPTRECVIFRIYKQNLRCEIDKYAKIECNGIRLVHCYGTCSSGWTIYMDMAKEATRLVL